MQSQDQSATDDLEIVEFLQTNYDEIDPYKPLYKVGRRRIYLKDLRNFMSADDVKRKERRNLIVKRVMKENKVDAFKNLLEYGYQISAFDEEKQTAIHFAFRNEYEFLTRDKGKLLFSSANDVNHTDCYGLSHLHIACALGNTIATKKYLNNNADINAPYDCEAKDRSIYDCSGFTPLHFAVKHHRYDTVKLLLEHGADVEVKDAEKRTLLYLTTLVLDYQYPSSWENELKIIKILLEYGCDLNAKDEGGGTVIMDIFWHFIYFGCEDLSKSEFDIESDSFINKTIEIDRRQRQKEILEIFIRHGADVLLSDKYGNTLLHSLLRNLEVKRIPNTFGHICFDDTMYLELVQLILTTNCEINVSLKNESGESPLSLAVSFMSLDIFKLLLNYTTDLSSIKFGPNAEKLRYLNTVPTFECVRNLIAIVKLLLDKEYKFTLVDDLDVLKFLIHGIDECDCHRFAYSDLGEVINFYSPIHVSCLNSIADRGRFDRYSLEDLQLNLELIEYASIYIHEDINNEAVRILQEFNVPLIQNLYHEDRVNEVKQMKSTKLRDGVYLYDVMTKHPHTIYPDIQSIIFDDKLIEDFEFYKSIIKGHFAKAITRHYVETSALNYLQISMFSLLPYLCCKKILSYLNNKDIYNLCSTILTYDLN